MNLVVLKGRLARDVELREAASGMSVARFTIAVERATKEKAADFISCIAFDKTARLVNDYFQKGSLILVQGEIRTGSYEKDGHKVYTTDVIATRVEFCESKKNSETSSAPTRSSAPFDDDIPF